MTKVCVVFPYSMGNDFMSGGVTKLVIQNLIVCSKVYDTHLLLPKDNLAFEKYVNENISNVQVHRIDFDFIASYADTADFLKRIILVSNRLIKAMMKRSNLYKTIKLIQPSIVHFHAEVSFLFLKRVKKLGIKSIFHTSSIRFADNKIQKKIVVDVAKKYADCIISPTKSIDEMYKNENKYILENPIVGTKCLEEIDDRERIVRDKRLKFIFTGRICRVKQIHYLLQAFKKIDTSSRCGIAAYIIGKPNNEGDESYYNELLEYVDKNGLDNIYFLGYRNNVKEYLKHADVGVLLSVSEAISMSCVEYMDSGLAVLGFDNPGINEVVIDGVNGRLVRDGDVSGLSDKILDFMNHTDTLLNYQRNAKEYSQEHFSIEAFRNKLLKIYEAVLKDEKM
mgnify:CR=1 FL=1